MYLSRSRNDRPRGASTGSRATFLRSLVLLLMMLALSAPLMESTLAKDKTGDSQPTAEVVTSPDTDGDTVADEVDNCVDTANRGQEDADGDGAGDACDATPLGDPTPEPTATDAPPEPTATDAPPEPTATDAPPEPTAKKGGTKTESTAKGVVVAAAPGGSSSPNGGDISADWVAAGPGTYNHKTGVGGAYGSRVINKNT